MCFFSQALAEPVPGTTVDIKPPSGYVKAERFSGFMNEATGSSIMVSEIPGPYLEVARGVSDEKRLQAKGMKLLDSSPVEVDGRTAMLLHVEQTAYGTVFKKWLLVVDYSDSTMLVVASYPSAEARKEEHTLKAAVLATSFGMQTDPIAALAFTVKPEAPFQIAKVMGQNLVLSPNGEFPVKNENVPFMVAALSASKGPGIPDKKRFAANHIAQTATVKGISLQQHTPVTIGHLAGYTTLAEGQGEDSATPITIYQVLLFDSSGYSVIKGVTPSRKRNEYLPLFEKMAASFVLKKQRNNAIESNKK